MQYKIDIPFEVEFEVKKINFRNDDDRFSIITAIIKKHTYTGDVAPEISIKGTFPSLIKGDVFKGTGSFKLSETHGYSIQLNEVPKAVLPQAKKGIAEFIKKRVKGLGMKTAERIVDTLGFDAITLIAKDYKYLLGIQGITEKRAIKIHEKIAEHKKFEEVAMFVQANGLESHVALKIYETFKDDSIKMVKENPYSICSIPKLDFTFADKFAYNLKLPYDGYERVKNAILYYIDYSMKNHGHICVFKDELLNRFTEFLEKLGSYSKDDEVPIDVKSIEKAIKYLVSKEYIVTETNEEDRVCIYRKDYNVIENNIIKNLKKLLSNDKKPFCVSGQIDDFLTVYEAKYFTLAKEQREAVYVSLQNGISILTGGPGTGKTQTTNTIVQCIYSIKPHARVVLLAPTGKASRRMTELTSKEASTIHRGIGLNGFNDSSELEEIDADYVIVDESSMIDAYVFNALLSNISEDTRLMFVGDYEQLPSVGPGLILRDLINSGKIPVTRLTQIFRQAKDSQIVMNSHSIIKGEKANITFDRNKKDFFFIENRDKLAVKNLILKSVENSITNLGYKMNDICVLSPMRKGDLGTDELNRIIQAKFNPPSSKPEYVVNSLKTLRVGDRVMQNINNYDLCVMNGDVGEITGIYSDDGDIVIEVQYPDKDDPVIYPEKCIDELELAYAITIHKSQGSEFPVVIMPIFDTQFSMLNRNIIYTGITRAKKMAVLIGTKDTLFKAMDKGDIIERNSRIKEKIQKEIA